MAHSKTNNNGEAEIEFSDNPEEDEMLLPMDFPVIGDGAIIEIAGLMSGTFQLES